jgi:hypothetical protein
MSLLALRAEFAQTWIGPLILAEVERAVDLVTPRYDPTVYARSESWAQARDDLIQDVVATVLIEEHQIDYLIQTANSLDDFRALLFRQVRRLLARRRQRTVVDNLLDRIREVLSRPPFEQAPGTPARYSLSGRATEHRSTTADEIYAAAARVAAIPRITFNVSERAPIIYNSEALPMVVAVIADSLPASFTLQDVDRILRLVLTDWIPRFLEEGEESFTARDEELTPEEMILVTDTVERLLAAITADQRLILLRKIEGVADGAVALEIGISRPTLAARKDAVFAILEPELDGMEPELQRAVMGQLALRLTAIGGTA